LADMIDNEGTNLESSLTGQTPYGVRSTRLSQERTTRIG